MNEYQVADDVGGPESDQVELEVLKAQRLVQLNDGVVEGKESLSSHENEHDQIQQVLLSFE
jgi:hypothetical protein